jgi:hypothetical protein
MSSLFFLLLVDISGSMKFSCNEDKNKDDNVDPVFSFESFEKTLISKSQTSIPVSLNVEKDSFEIVGDKKCSSRLNNSIPCFFRG